MKLAEVHSTALLNRRLASAVRRPRESLLRACVPINRSLHANNYLPICHRLRRHVWLVAVDRLVQVGRSLVPTSKWLASELVHGRCVRIASALTLGGWFWRVSYTDRIQHLINIGITSTIYLLPITQLNSHQNYGAVAECFRQYRAALSEQENIKHRILIIDIFRLAAMLWVQIDWKSDVKNPKFCWNKHIYL